MISISIHSREKDVFKATVGIYFNSTESYYESVCKVVFKWFVCFIHFYVRKLQKEEE